MSRFVSLLDGPFAADWELYLRDKSVAYVVGARVGSHRATTSSRTPGKVNRGTVYANRAFAHGELHLCGCGIEQRLCTGCNTWVCQAPGHLQHVCEASR